MAERSPSRLRQAGSYVASGVPSPGNTEEQNYGKRDSPRRDGGRGAESSRVQVQSALDGLLSDNEGSRDAQPSYGYRPTVEDTTTASRSPSPTGGRRSSFRPGPIAIGGADGTRRGPSSSGLLSPGSPLSPGGPTGGGYTPTAGAGRRYIQFGQHTIVCDILSDRWCEAWQGLSGSNRFTPAIIGNKLFLFHPNKLCLAVHRQRTDRISHTPCMVHTQSTINSILILCW